MRIQHNIMAMNAYRNYNTNTKALSGNLEKLSSGYKINRAGDDAAGLAISEKMRAQITGLDAAQKNVKDGISLVKTAEGAMQEIQDMLNRMDYLATQSANGTYDNEVDRANLQKEVDALKTEINRIADSANFNGIKLLDGSLDEGTDVVDLAPGATNVNVTHKHDGQLVTKEPQAGKYSIDFSQAKISNLDTNDATFTFALTDDIEVSLTLGAGEELSGDGLANAIKNALEKDTTFTAGIEYNGGDSKMKFNLSVEGDKLVMEMVDAPDKDFDTKLKAEITDPDGDTLLSVTGEQFQVTPEVEAVAKTSREYAQGSFTLTANDVKDGKAIKIGDTTYVFAVGKDSKFKDYDNAIDLTDYKEIKATDINVAAQRLAQVAKNNKNFHVGSNLNDGVISLTEKEGGVDYSKNNLAGTDNKGVLNGGGGTANDANATNWAGLVQKGTAKISNKASGTALTLQIGDTADSYNQMKVSVGDMHTKALGIAGVDISNQEGAAAAIETVRNAINQVSSVRGDLGAIQNRLEHTGNNLSVMAENIQDAESTIRDTDVAEEMMSYVKNNILVQSAQAMLAQANQVPQGVLQLLG